MPTDRIDVPWWIVRAIARGWERYGEKPSEGIEKAFSIKALKDSGPGKPITRRHRYIRDCNLVADIITLEHDGTKRTVAIRQVAREYDMSPDAVRKIYKNRPEEVVQKITEELEQIDSLKSR